MFENHGLIFMFCFRVEYQRVTCPKELTDITGCIRVDEDTFLTEAAKVGKTSSGAVTIAAGAGLPSILVWAMSALFASSVLFMLFLGTFYTILASVNQSGFSVSFCG